MEGLQRTAARGTLCARASQVACTLRPRQGSAPLRYLGGSAWQFCCAALEVWLCSAAAHPPMLRKDVDAVEKTTVVEKDRAGAEGAASGYTHDSRRAGAPLFAPKGGEGRPNCSTVPW